MERRRFISGLPMGIGLAAASSFAMSGASVPARRNLSAAAPEDPITYGELASAGGAELVGHLRPEAGAQLRTLSAKLNDTLSVLDFIPVNLHAAIRDGSNFVDLLGYLNAALNAAALAKSELIFPAGDYVISARLVVTQPALCLRFEGRAKLSTTSPTDHILVIGDGSGNPANIRIDGLVCSAKVPKTDGACIYVRNGNDIRITDFIAAFNVHDGVVFEGGAQQFGYYLERFLITDFTGHAIRLQAGGGIGVQDVFLRSGVIDGHNRTDTVGVYLLSGGGTYADSIDIMSCDNGVCTYPATGNAVNYSFFTQVISDSCLQDCWSLNDNGGSVLVFNLSNCWGASSVGGNGFQSGGTAPSKIRNVTIANSVFPNNWRSGVLWNHTDNHILSTCNVSGNNRGGLPNLCGVRIEAGCKFFSVIGNIVDNEYFLGVSGQQKYGILVVGGSNDYVISGNICRRAETDNLLDLGPGPNRQVIGNLETSA